jgi:putative ABC transport system permease protein
MLLNYFKNAWRNLQKHKIYAGINIAGMAIGLTAFWLIALYVGDEMSYDRQFANADNIYRIAQHATWDGGSFDIVPTAPPLATALQTNFPEVETTARLDIEGGGIIQYGDKSFKQNDICVADNTFFKIFNYRFLYGDAVNALINPNTIVLTESPAKRIFGDAAAAMNKTIYFGSNNPVRITGVIADMPVNSHLQFSGIRAAGTSFNNDGWQNTYVYTYIMLKKGTDKNDFAKKLETFGNNTIAKEMKVTHYTAELQPLTAIHLRSNLAYEFSQNGSISRIYMFCIIGILVLLIALINYMNLSTARASMRVKEIGIRKVIGSARKNLVALFIAEALLVTLFAACIAGILVQLSLPFFNQLSGKTLGIWRFGKIITITVLLLFAIITGIISGSYPALLFSRFKMIPSLKGQLGNMQTSILFRKSLVVFQFTIAVCLISGSYIIYKQMKYVSQKDLGFNKEQVATFHIDNMQVRNSIPALKQALLQNPLIEAAAIAGNPIGNNDLNENDFLFEKNGAMPATSTLANKLFVDEDFLATTGISLLQGRNFSADMPTDKDDAVIINETLMKTLGYTNAIGKKMQFRVNDSMHTNTIVGVVKDFHTYSLQHKIAPLVLLMPPNNKEKDNLYIKIAKGKAAEGLAYLKKTYASFDKNNAADFHFLDENFEKQYAAEQKQEQLSFAFTVLAFIIACLGLTGLAIFSAAQRVKEIGIRKVLGASVFNVTTMLGRDFMKLICIAAIIAIPVAWLTMNKWLQDFAYHVQLQWWMFLLPACTAILIALVTVSIQAIKAAVANPVKSLRTE